MVARGSMAADYESRRKTARKKFPDELLGTKRRNIRVNTRSKVIATRRRRILGISDFLVILFFPMPVQQTARAPTSPWIRHEESSESPFLPAIDALFLHQALVVWRAMCVWYTCSRQSVQSGNTRVVTDVAHSSFFPYIRSTFKNSYAVAKRATCVWNFHTRFQLCEYRCCHYLTRCVY